MKEKTKKSGRWWYPILAGIAVPLLGILGASLITAGFFALLQAFGTDLTSLGVFPMLMTDILKIILAAVIILIMKRISHGSFYFGFGAKNLRESIALASIALVFALCNVLEAVFFNGILQENGLVLLASVISALAAGFYEEIACRGVVVTSMMENWKTAPHYILRTTLVSGILFGLIHFVNLTSGDIAGTFLQVFYAAGIGIFFGAVYIRTRNLWGAFLVHFIVDATAFIFVIQNPSEIFSMAGSLVLLIIITGFGLYLIRPAMYSRIKEVWAEKSR